MTFTISFQKISLICLFALSAFVTSAQDSKTETFAVSGNCGSCKKNIEKAALNAGATEASWDMENKTLAVTYPATTTPVKIQQSIAAAGYDTPEFKASNAAYKRLDKCCQYERGPAKKGDDLASGKDCCAKDAAPQSCCLKDKKELAVAKAKGKSCCIKTN